MNCADADPGLRSAELTSAQDREGHRVNLRRAGQAGRTEQSAQMVTIICVPGRTKEMSHAFCFLADPYKFLKVIYFN